MASPPGLMPSSPAVNDSARQALEHAFSETYQYVAAEQRLEEVRGGRMHVEA